MFKRLDIRNKLALVLWGPALLALVLVGGASTLFDRLTREARTSRALEPYAQLVSVGANAAVAFEDPVRAQQILNTLHANPQIIEAAIILEDGRILASHNHTPSAKPDLPWPTANGLYLGDHTATLVQGLQRKGRLVLTSDLDHISGQTRVVYWMAGVGMIVLLAITFGQMAVLQRTIIRPIATLAGAAERVRDRNDYHINLRDNGTDEVARLSRSLDDMMAAVREREDDLRRLTVFQRTLLDNAANSIISTTPSGIISSFNPAAERMLGYAAVEVVGKRSPIDWHDPEEIRQRASQLSRELGEMIAPDFRVFTTLALRNLPDEYEWTCIRKDGTRVPALLSIAALRDANGEVTGFVGIAKDLTERKQMEKQSLRAQRMEAVGTLASGIAHDLNNILSPILMAAEILKQGKPSPQDLDVLSMIEASAQRGASIIRQLLLFGRGVDGTRAQIHPKSLLKEMVEIMRETFPRNIAIKDASPDDLCAVHADPTQLHQVLMNLCVNARDAMPNGGELEVSGQNLTFCEGDSRLDSQAKPGPYVMVSVADTGNGIAPEILDSIFDPFFTTKEIGKGSGLGLSTVLAIAKKHGGFVRVDSQPGKGSVFSVFLPAIVSESAGLPRNLTTPLQTGGGELILIVDDEAAIRRTLRHLLEHNGYRVLTAAHGQEALGLHQQHRNDVRLVLTDLMMPVMDGVELVRTLKAMDPGLKVIATSGLDAEVNRAQLLALGVSEILAKPIQLKTLLQAIREQLESAPATGILSHPES